MDPMDGLIAVMSCLPDSNPSRLTRKMHKNHKNLGGTFPGKISLQGFSCEGRPGHKYKHKFNKKYWTCILSQGNTQLPNTLIRGGMGEFMQQRPENQLRSSKGNPEFAIPTKLVGG